MLLCFFFCFVLEERWVGIKVFVKMLEENYILNKNGYILMYVKYMYLYFICICLFYFCGSEEVLASIIGSIVYLYGYFYLLIVLKIIIIFIF